MNDLSIFWNAWVMHRRTRLAVRYVAVKLASLS